MLLAALLAALAGLWAWKAGRLGPNPGAAMATGAAALGAVWLAIRGQWAGGLALAALSAVLAWRLVVAARVAAQPMDEIEARQLLGVGLEATPEDIIAAHRRIIIQVHPDRGGSAELARRVNAARDRLLRPRD
jgi:hypothetical protein